MEYLEHVHVVLVRDVSERFPGNDAFIAQLATLLTTSPPGFIYIHDPHTVRSTSRLLNRCLSALSALEPAEFGRGGREDLPPRFSFAQLDAVACFVPRLFYDGALNQLAGWTPAWEDGCENWTHPGGTRTNDGFDGFIHGVQALDEQLRGPREAARKGRKGKGKAKVKGDEDGQVRMVIVVERVERMKDALRDLVVPLSRLGELSRVDVTTVFLSEVPWEEIKPAKGAALDPYRMSVSAPTREAATQKMMSNFTATSSSAASDKAHPYHPDLSSLYQTFTTTLYDLCELFTRDPDELAYIAAARWPGFVQPVLDAYATNFAEDPDTKLDTTGLESRARLATHFKSTFVVALEELYPRTTNAAAWAKKHASRPPITDAGPSSPRKAARTLDAPGDDGDTTAKGDDIRAVRALPEISRFVLIAAYLASTNPPKSDLRMFGREAERRRKRKGGGARKHPTRGTQAKVPQRLAGPTSFPLDRMLAILGFLLDAYDLDSRDLSPEFAVPGSYTELELGRVHVYGAISELSTMHLLQRTSAPEKIDGPPTFKCGISHDLAMALARDMKVPLLELIWDAQN